EWVLADLWTEPRAEFIVRIKFLDGMKWTCAAGSLPSSMLRSPLTMTPIWALSPKLITEPVQDIARFFIRTPEAGSAAAWRWKAGFITALLLAKQNSGTC